MRWCDRRSGRPRDLRPSRHRNARRATTAKRPAPRGRRSSGLSRSTLRGRLEPRSGGERDYRGSISDGTAGVVRSMASRASTSEPPDRSVRAQGDRDTDRPDRPDKNGDDGEATNAPLGRPALLNRARQCSNRRRDGHLVQAQELLLVIDAVHLARAPPKHRHRSERAGRAPRTWTARAPATGGRVGDDPGVRPLARRRDSPSRRPFRRRPASQGTCL